ncbi:MAG: hypothetical protein LBR38_03110, partial [Synergistaceae bacterium]|nr:hypothetical protein [Synergistaceae bacterium]
RDGTAEQNPLLIRTTIRDKKTGGIVAYDRFTWNVVDDKTVGTDNEWIFVPVDDPDPDKNKVSYRLVTEVANYTGVRYALQRYDGYDWQRPEPQWAFDVPRTGNEDLPSRLKLYDLSHIAPGLLTIYDHTFSVISGRKDTLRMYPVDPTVNNNDNPAGWKTLTMQHRSIFGLDLGTEADESKPVKYSVSGFKLLQAGPDFLNKAGEAVDVGTAVMPEVADGVMSGAVSYKYIAGDVISSFAINARMPSRVRGGGMLPVHVTMNLPRTNQLVGRRWDELLERWREAGDIKSLFSGLFGVFLRAADGSNLDLNEYLQEQVDKTGDQYLVDRVMKVFLDEEKELITVQFIVLLTDGGGETIRLVEDESTAPTRNTYIVVRDGSANDRWDMTFFAAPAKYVKTDVKGESSKGGGCSVGGVFMAFAMAVALAALFFVRKTLRR